MPREQIQYPRVERVEIGSVKPGEEAVYSSELRESTAPLVHIGWYAPGNPNEMPGWMQLSLECTREWLEQALEGMSEDSRTIFLFSETFTRDETNQLVRLLRRARDRVFGKDE